MDKDIKVSVLMPVFNAEAFLKPAIESVINQTYSDFEFIIINDGSTDTSEKIILSYKDPRIKYLKNDNNLKLISTLNKGFALARGKYIIRMDSDDISLPERFGKQVEFMDSHPDIALSGTWFHTFGEVDHIVKYAVDNDTIRVRMLHQTQFCHPTVIIRKEILDKMNYRFDPDFIHAEDYELFVRIAECHPVANLPSVLLNYRTHKDNVSIIHKNTQTENTKKIIINQFKKLKSDFNDKDFELYYSFAYSMFSNFNKSSVEKLNDLLSILFASNSKVLFLPSRKLKEYWAEKLFHFCYNVDGCMDIWKKSVFYEKGKMTFIKALKKQLKKIR